MLDHQHALWIDFETSNPDVDLKTSGACRYADDPATKAIVLAYAIDGDEARSWHGGGAALNWAKAPRDLREAFASDRPLVAWNAAFDREIWNHTMIGSPLLEPGRLLDAMAQAMASNLPAGLDDASLRLGGPGKQKDGKALIKLFSIECADPAEHAEEWQRYDSYARGDVETMRDVVKSTLPLSPDEWAEYAAFEVVNARGIGVDVPFVEAAARMAAEDRVQAARRLKELTSGEVGTVNQAARIAGWLHAALPQAEARAILEKVAPEDDEVVGEEDTLALTLQRPQVTRLRLWLEAKRQREGLTEAEAAAEEVATLREFGASAAPSKFARMAAQHVGGTIANQYVFGGAAQTGRMSSRSIQIHNLSRDTVGARSVEGALVDAIADDVGYDAVKVAEPAAMPVARKLGLLVRPALVAGAGKVFCWSDWSAVEARITPWLAKSRGGDGVLDVFRANDADPSLPDIYKVAAAGILGKEATEISATERQTGKVATLALGFGGGHRALQSMAGAYGMLLDEDEARDIVVRWRRANAWAPAFWGRHGEHGSSGLWGAALRAWETPGSVTSAGRVAFYYDGGYLGGSLFLCLPSGRLLTYPEPKWRTVPVVDDAGAVTGTREELTFRRPYGRARLWRGTLCENAVQATAADLLRGTIRRLVENPDYAFMPVRAHTHDEVLVECDTNRVDEARAALRGVMLQGFDWSDGLPLASEETVLAWYSKAKARG